MTGSETALVSEGSTFWARHGDAVIASIAPCLAALSGFLILKKKVEVLHVLVNSRMTDLLNLTAQASQAEGVELERVRTSLEFSAQERGARKEKELQKAKEQP